MTTTPANNGFWQCVIDKNGNTRCPWRRCLVHVFDWCDFCSHKRNRIGQRMVLCSWSEEVQHEQG